MARVFAFLTDFETEDDSAVGDLYTVVDLAVSRLTSVFSEKPLIKALTQAMVAPFNEIHAGAKELRENRWIDTAIGTQLDGCGIIVGEPRKGRTDDEYREALKFRIFVNTSNGTPEDLIAAIRFLTKPDDVQYIEQYPATSMIFTDGSTIASNINTVMQDLAPAAISNLPILVSFTRKDPFRFGKQSPNNELFVNDDYLDVNGSDLQLSGSQVVSGSRLGGVVPADMFVGESYIEVNGAILAINNPNTNKVQNSGYQLTGLYSV